MVVRTERARVLITVKATPQPSTKYGDTVCVAGIRIDGDRAEWIRLYPIAFRWLDNDEQFTKYDVIDIDIRRAHHDTRRESYTPTLHSWKHVEHLPPWRARHDIVQRLTPTTTCELIRGARTDTAAPSLGLVYPSRVDPRLEILPHPAWTPAEVKKMRDRIDQESAALLPMSGTIPTVLREPRFIVRYHYWCQTSGCNGHEARNLDWELTRHQTRLDRDDTIARQQLHDRWFGMMFGADRASGFFVGNQESADRRRIFSVLGAYYPRRSETEPTLF